MSRDALVVGINTYQYLPSLKAPARDAEAIAQQLHAYGEFRVHRLPEVIQEGKPKIGQKTQVSLRDLETALINLFKPRGNAPQTAVFYFSGHGIQRDAGIREGYLALSDSNPDKGFYGLSLFWLRRLLQESPVRQRIIWLDCCHSGELLNFLEADPGAHPGTDRLFMAASREYETAYESLDSEYSVFTDALLTGLDPNRVAAGIVTNHSLTDWVNHTLKGEIQQPLFESSGSEIILTRRNSEAGGAPRLAQSTIQSKDICPYRGLEFFDESHAEYFFGREELTAQLLKKVVEERFVAVTGPSGSGKSSLVRAGLIAQLRQGKKISGSNQWKIRLITPTEHPLKSLATAFIDPDLNDLERAEQLRRAETFLQDGGVGLAQLVRASLPVPTGLSSEQQPQFLLVIDQFEEVFTLSQGAQAERERQEFFDCLLGAAEIVKDLLSIVIVLRSDFCNKCSFYEGLAQRISQQPVTVSPLKYEQIKATIVQPAQKVGLVCEPNLVYTMLLDVIGAPGELPLLQYTLLELWRRRRVGAEGGVARLTLDAYQELGGVRGTLQKRATEVFHCLSAEEQVVARRIFLALTQLGEGTEDTRRRVVKSELVSPTFPVTLVDQVLEKLATAKLVVISQENISPNEQPDQEPPDQKSASISTSTNLPSGSTSTIATALTRCLSQEIVDVAHEALIRNWSLLRSWLEESREMLRRQRRIEQAAQEWDHAGQPASGEYLLHGLRLRDAEDFLKLYPQELSALAQQYIQVSCTECRRARRESRQLQIAIPTLLVITLTVVLGQYYGAMRTQTEKEDQLKQATARERAAITQAVLQDSKADPMTALLIGRLAAEGTATGYEAQSSLRAALQNLRLQLELRGHQGAVQQIAFSPNHQYLGTASTDGTIRLWAVNARTIYSTSLNAVKVLPWAETNGQVQPINIRDIAFSPDSQHLAAIAQDASVVKVWSVSSGTMLHQLVGSAVVRQVSFSPDGVWIATAGEDRRISIWQASTGALKLQLQQNGPIQSLQFSPDGQLLLSVGEDGTVQIWQLEAMPDSLNLTPTKTLTHPDVIHEASFSPSGRWVATLAKDGNVRLWDRQTGQLQHLIPNPVPASKPTPQSQNATDETPVLPIQQMEFSPDEQTLATIDSRQQVWLWHLQSGQLGLKLDSNSSQAAQPSNLISPKLLKFSPNGGMVITTGYAPVRGEEFYPAYLWNSQTGQQIGKLSGHQKSITSVQFSPDGTYVVTASVDGTVRLWATEQGGELPSVRLGNNSAEGFTFLPSHFIKAQNALPNSAIADLADSTDDRIGTQAPTLTAASGTRGELQVGAYNHANGSPLSTAKSQIARWQPWQNWFQQNSSESTSQTVVASASSNRPRMEKSEFATTGPSLITNMITLTADGQLQRWQIFSDTLASDTDKQQDIELAGSHTAAIPTSQNAPSLREKLTDLVQLHFDQLINRKSFPVSVGFAQFSQLPFLQTLTELSATNPLKKLGGLDAKAALSGFAMSSDGQLLAAADIAGWVSIYRVQPDQSLQLLKQIQNWRSTGGLTNSSTSSGTKSLSQVISHTDNQKADMGRDKKTQPEVGEPVAIRHLSFSPDGQQLLGIADDLTMRSWNAHSGQSLAVFQGHEATIRQARFSHDGQWIISASWDRTARLWQASTGQVVKIFRHEDAVSSASFTPDGQRIVTTSWDGTGQVWQLDTGNPLFRLNKHQKAILDAQFSPDGRLLVTASADGTARLWNAMTGEEQATLRPNVEKEPEAILRAFFSPDGQYVATLSRNGRVDLWAATWEMLLKLARERSLRQLTLDECSRYLRLSAEQCTELSP